MLLAVRCQLSLETSPESVVRIFLRKVDLQKGYIRNAAIHTNDVYATLYWKKGYFINYF